MESTVTTKWMKPEENSVRVEGMSAHIIIDNKEEEKKRKEADMVKVITDKEIDKMIENTQIIIEQKILLRDMIRKRRTAFVEYLKPAGQVYFEPHDINLRTNEPVWTTQHRRSEIENGIIDKEALEQYRKGVIRRVWSLSYNSPMMVVKKKDGRWRSVIDYRHLKGGNTFFYNSDISILTVNIFFLGSILLFQTSILEKKKSIPEK